MADDRMMTAKLPPVAVDQEAIRRALEFFKSLGALGQVLDRFQDREREAGVLDGKITDLEARHAELRESVAGLDTLVSGRLAEAQANAQMLVQQAADQAAQTKIEAEAHSAEVVTKAEQAVLDLQHQGNVAKAELTAVLAAIEDKKAESIRLTERLSQEHAERVEQAKLTLSALHDRIEARTGELSELDAKLAAIRADAAERAQKFLGLSQSPHPQQESAP